MKHCDQQCCPQKTVYFINFRTIQVQISLPLKQVKRIFQSEKKVSHVHLNLVSIFYFFFDPTVRGPGRRVTCILKWGRMQFPSAKRKWWKEERMMMVYRQNDPIKTRPREEDGNNFEWNILGESSSSSSSILATVQIVARFVAKVMLAWRFRTTLDDCMIHFCLVAGVFLFRVIHKWYHF